MNDLSEKSKHQRLKDYFSHKYELILDDFEIEEIMAKSDKESQKFDHIGYHSDRCQHNKWELAFQQEWLKENEPLEWINSGHGILQDLFIEEDTMRHKKFHLVIQPRDRYIVATIIQWLGTNCGSAFLDKALKRVGYKITKIQ